MDENTHSSAAPSVSREPASSSEPVGTPKPPVFYCHCVSEYHNPLPMPPSPQQSRPSPYVRPYKSRHNNMIYRQASCVWQFIQGTGSSLFRKVLLDLSKLEVEASKAEMTWYKAGVKTSHFSHVDARETSTESWWVWISTTSLFPALLLAGGAGSVIRFLGFFYSFGGSDWGAYGPRASWFSSKLWSRLGECIKGLWLRRFLKCVRHRYVWYPTCRRKSDGKLGLFEKWHISWPIEMLRAD